MFHQSKQNREWPPTRQILRLYIAVFKIVENESFARSTTSTTKQSEKQE